jgi:hypothetical protein
LIPVHAANRVFGFVGNVHDYSRMAAAVLGEQCELLVGNRVFANPVFWQAYFVLGLFAT